MHYAASGCRLLLGMKKRIHLKGRSLLTLSDVTGEELVYLLEFADRLKKARNAGMRGDRLKGRSIALIFEKASTRTRCAFAVAAADEGGCVETLGVNDIHLGRKESIKDTARVLGRMFDGIQFRGYKHETAEMLARFSGVPVWNGLTDISHPTQALADLMTMREYFKRLEGLKVVYVGDGRNNVCLSLMEGCAKMGMHFVDCTPPELSPPLEDVERANEIARAGGGCVSLSHDPEAAVCGANVIYTDVWVSMGEESKFDERLRLLMPYRVDMKMMLNTGNMESNGLIFLHCLPAFHDHCTDVTRESGALEVTDDVFESPFSKVFDQAENRLHTIKAVMIATVTGGESAST